MPDQNFEESVNCQAEIEIEANHHDLENLLCLHQKSKSFTLNTENFKSLIETDETSQFNEFSSYTKIKNQTSSNTNINKHSIELLNSNSSNNNETHKENNTEKDSNANSKNSSKIKYKNVVQFKKDVVIKKLLKTIDVMNQELSKGYFHFNSKVHAK